MGWFGRRKRDFADELCKALKNENVARAGEILLEAFDQHHDKPESFVPLMMMVADIPYAPLYGIIDLFAQTFPNIFNPTQVNLAALYAEEGKVGIATDLARDFLNKCMHYEILEKLSDNKVIARVVGWAFLLTSAGYQKAGAKTYSVRILKESLKYDIDSATRKKNQGEIDMLQQELANADDLALDAKWEEFFKNAAHAKELFDHCNRIGLPELATRVDLLEANIRYGNRMSFEQEYLKKVVRVIDGDGPEAHAFV